MKRLIVFLSFILFVVTSCQDKQAMAELDELKAKAELEELNKTIIQSYWDGKWNERRLEILDELQTPNIVYHGPSHTMNGIEEYKQVYASLLSATQDSRIVVEELIAEENLVLSRTKIAFKQTGVLMGVPPTGNEISFDIFTVFRIDNGKIAEEWEMNDRLELMQQLGMELQMKE